jgi:hypothetical protein
MSLTPLKTELKVLTHPLLHESFRWQVFSEEGDCLPHYVKFAGVPRCPSTPD